MADLITFAGVEKEYVVGICYSLIAADVPHVNAAIGKYEMCGRNTFFRTAMTASTAAADVSQRHSIRVQQMIDFELGHGRQPDWPHFNYTNATVLIGLSLKE